MFHFADNRRNPLAASFAALCLVAATGAGAAGAQSISSTVQLKQACETSPSNTVVLSQATKIFVGAQPPAVEAVTTGCTIVVGPDFEFERVAMSFAGPLVIQGPGKSSLKLIESILTAPSVTVQLAGTTSTFEMTHSAMQASLGNLFVTLAPEATLLVHQRNPFGPQHALSATGAVQLHTGRKVSGLISQAAIRAPQGLLVSLTGFEPKLRLEEVVVDAPLGSVQFSSNGSKTELELNQVTLRFANMLSFRLTGQESILRLVQVDGTGANGVQATGGVTAVLGTVGTGKGKIEALESTFTNVGNVILQASATRPQGYLKVENSQFDATGEVLMQTGAQGYTEVLGNTGSSQIHVRASVGTGGTCIESNNLYTAPSVLLCN